MNFTSSFIEVLAALAKDRRAREGLATFVARHIDPDVPAVNYRCSSAEAAAIGAFLEKAGLEREKAWTTIVSQLDPDTCQIRWLDKGQDEYGAFRKWASCLTLKDASLLVPACGAGEDPSGYLPVAVEAPAEAPAEEGRRPAPDPVAISDRTMDIARTVVDAFNSISVNSGNRPLLEWARETLSRQPTGNYDPVAPLAAVELHVRWNRSRPGATYPPHWPAAPVFSCRFCRHGTVAARLVRDGESLPAGGEIMSLPLPEQLGSNSPLDGYLCRTASELRSMPTSDKVAVWVQVDAPIDSCGYAQATPDGIVPAAFAALRFAMDSEAMKNYVCDLYSEAYRLEVTPLCAARLAVHNLENLDPRFAPQGMPCRAALYEDEDEDELSALGYRVENSALMPGMGIAWRGGLLFLPTPPSFDQSLRSSCGARHSPLPIVYGPPPKMDPNTDDSGFLARGLADYEMSHEWYSMVHGRFFGSGAAGIHRYSRGSADQIPAGADLANLDAFRRISATAADCMPGSYPVPPTGGSWTQSTAFAHGVVASLRRAVSPGTELPFTAPENRPAGTADYVFAGIWSGVANGHSDDVTAFGGGFVPAWPRFRGYRPRSDGGFVLPPNPELGRGTTAALDALRTDPGMQLRFTPTPQTTVGELTGGAGDLYQVVVETNVDADGYLNLLDQCRSAETLFGRLRYVFCNVWIGGGTDPTCALNEPWSFTPPLPRDLPTFCQFLGADRGLIRQDPVDGTLEHPYGPQPDLENGCSVEFARDAAGRLVIVFSMDGAASDLARTIWRWRAGIPVLPARYLACRDAVATPAEFRLPADFDLDSITKEDVRRYLTLEIMQPGAFDAGFGPYMASIPRYLGAMWRPEDVSCLDSDENVNSDMYTCRMVVHAEAGVPFSHDVCGYDVNVTTDGTCPS